MTNLFLGLAKGARRLRPASTRFSALRYEALVEEKVKVGPPDEHGNRRSIAPDLLLYSQQAENSLVLEYTRDSNPRRKNDQFNRYGMLNGSDLTNGRPYVPKKAAHSHDVTVVIPRRSLRSYEAYAKSEGHNFALLGCSPVRSSVSLSKAGSPFSVKEVDKIFSETTSLPEIPTGYFSFCQEEPDAKDLARKIGAHLIALLQEGVESVSIDEFCPACYALEWPIMGQELKQRVRKQTRVFLTAVQKTEIAKMHLLYRINAGSNSPAMWSIRNISEEPFNVQQSVWAHLFAMAKRPPQLELFD
ncbi:MAG: hypothetical protein AAFP15_09425 [Bacteroidota bacterium]